MSVHSKGMVCQISPKEAHALEFEGEEPNCRQHRHTSKAKANELIADSVRTLDDSGNWTRIAQVRWIGIGKRRFVYERARAWRMVPSGPTHMRVMQLVPSGGAW